MNINDILIKYKNYILKSEKSGYIPNSININKIKIFGKNIYSLNETKRALLSNILYKYLPTMLLLNECNKGKAPFNMSGYNLILSRNQKLGNIYRKIYFLNDICLKMIMIL